MRTYPTSFKHPQDLGTRFNRVFVHLTAEKRAICSCYFYIKDIDLFHFSKEKKNHLRVNERNLPSSSLPYKPHFNFWSDVALFVGLGDWRLRTETHSPLPHLYNINFGKDVLFKINSEVNVELDSLFSFFERRKINYFYESKHSFKLGVNAICILVCESAQIWGEWRNGVTISRHFWNERARFQLSFYNLNWAFVSGFVFGLKTLKVNLLLAFY